MSTDYPGAIDNFSTKVDNVDDVLAAHINNPQDSIVAIETLLGAGGGNLASANIFINGGFDVWQRTTDDTGIAGTEKYVADRWRFVTGSGTLTHVQRSTTVRTGAKTRYSCELVGTAGVTTVDIAQRIEAALVGQYKQTLSFSCYIYNGSGSAFTPTLYVSTPSAADDWTTSTVRNGGGSGEALQECADSAWAKMTWSADVSGYTNIDNGIEFRVRVPSGYLVASDTVRLAEMQLLPGDDIYPDFVSRGTLEFDLCQRYYQKSFNYSISPGTASTAGQRMWRVRGAIAASTAGFLFRSTPFVALMRTSPTAVIYSPNSGTANAVYNSSTGLDRTGCTAASVSEATISAIQVDNTSANAINLDNVIQFHFALDAEL